MSSTSDAASINPFVEKTYQDTYELLVSIRDYISGSMQDEAEVLEAPDQLRLTRELSSVTRDLTDVMAWLMLQKAIEVGELSQEDANAEPAGNFGDKTD
jgi:regulator of CtrA degradation